MILMFEALNGRSLALHIEFKHPGERLSPGQAEAYPLRAACWASGNYRPRSLPTHDDWMTAIFMEDAQLQNPLYAPFNKRVGHNAARNVIPGYPS